MSTKAKPLWRGVFLLSLAAALFTAVYKSMDNITVHNIATAEDGLTAAFAYLTVGGWTGVISGLIFSLIFGKRLLDRDFNGLVIRNSELHKQALISGAISAGGTLFLLWGNQLGDPSMLIALGNGVIVYTALYDIFTRQASGRQLIVPILLVIVGGALAAFSGSFYVTFLGILMVGVISNGLTALSEVVEQKGARASDGVNLFVWRFFWLATTGTALAYVVTTFRGYTAMWVATMQNLLLYLPWVVLTMFFVFLGIGLKLVLKKTNTISVVLLIMSVQIILGYPITLLGDSVHPGLFGEIPTDIAVWAIRVIGALLMIVGIIVLRNNHREESN